MNLEGKASRLKSAHGRVSVVCDCDSIALRLLLSVLFRLSRPRGVCSGGRGCGWGRGLFLCYTIGEVRACWVGSGGGFLLHFACVGFVLVIACSIGMDVIEK